MFYLSQNITINSSTIRLKNKFVASLFEFYNNSEVQSVVLSKINTEKPLCLHFKNSPSEEIKFATTLFSSHGFSVKKIFRNKKIVTLENSNKTISPSKTVLVVLSCLATAAFIQHTTYHQKMRLTALIQHQQKQTKSVQLLSQKLAKAVSKKNNPLLESLTNNL